MRVQRNAVTTYSRTGIKGHEAERFCGGSAYDFPCVYVQSVAEASHFVCHAYVDGAESVLKEFGGFGDASGANGENFFDDLRVKVRCCFCRCVRAAANDF